MKPQTTREALDELSRAWRELKHALYESLEPVLAPVVRLINRLIKRY